MNKRRFAVEQQMMEFVPQWTAACSPLQGYPYACVFCLFTQGSAHLVCTHYRSSKSLVEELNLFFICFEVVSLEVTMLHLPAHSSNIFTVEKHEVQGTLCVTHRHLGTGAADLHREFCNLFQVAVPPHLKSSIIGPLKVSSELTGTVYPQLSTLPFSLALIQEQQGDYAWLLLDISSAVGATTGQ